MVMTPWNLKTNGLKKGRDYLSLFFSIKTERAIILLSMKLRLFEKINTTISEYKNWFVPIALSVGFVFDLFTLNRVDQVFDNSILILHLLIVGTTIGILVRKKKPFRQTRLSEKQTRLLQSLVTFSLGALFSGFIIFYGRSGSLRTSWLFFIIMLIILIGTEVKKRYFQKMILQISLFYTALFSWAIFFIPVVTRKIGIEIFILSTVTSLALITLFVHILEQVNPSQIYRHKRKIYLRIIVIALIGNILYFTNIIPPIPLSLKYKGVYHNIQRIPQGGYLLQYEETPYWNFWRKRSRTIHWQRGEDVFIFSEIFAPTDLNTTIIHHWEYYDDENRSWERTDSIPIDISGGREQGYRGFSKKENLDLGTWRIKITNTRGQVLGITQFRIKQKTTSIEIGQETR
jgi:hypothetical protein